MTPRSFYIWFLLILLLVLTSSLSASAGAIDYVGLRITLPLGKIPFLVGIDLGMRLPFGWGIASLLINSDGRTLILGSVEVALTGEGSVGMSLIRATAGISYFDLNATFPSPVFGGGIAYRLSSEAGFQIGLGAEILYPLAFGSSAIGPPFLSIGGGWLP
ncbi:MAG: hypothetical protein U9N00_04030 [Candidatus Bipolaricaulota bacterium]|nr:hypothetical protein [Candidatus Bipolaricaulota bacterium]